MTDNRQITHWIANLDTDNVDDWAQRAPDYTPVSLGQDIATNVNTPAEVTGDDSLVSSNE